YPAAEERHRVPDDVEVLLEADPQVVPHVQVPGLADDGHDRRPGGEERGEVAVVGGAHAGTPRRPEGGAARLAPPEPAAGADDRAEELRVARIRAGPPALDVVDAELVERLGDAQLVVEREADVLGLRAVAQGGVVELDPSHQAAGRKASCSARTASSQYLASTTTEILISDVEIIWMLIPSAASTSNMRAAMPACVRMPTPTIDTLATSRSPRTSRAPIVCAIPRTSSRAWS